MAVQILNFSVRLAASHVNTGGTSSKHCLPKPPKPLNTHTIRHPISRLCCTLKHNLHLCRRHWWVYCVVVVGIEIAWLKQDIMLIHSSSTAGDMQAKHKYTTPSSHQRSRSQSSFPASPLTFPSPMCAQRGCLKQSSNYVIIASKHSLLPAAVHVTMAILNYNIILRSTLSLTPIRE
jgi:hypothetical protein